MERNTLKCVLTGAERITNNSYLNKRLDKLGVTEEQFRKHYISKICAQNLADNLRETGLEKTAQSLLGAQGHAYSADDVIKMLTYNGKNKLLLKSLWEKNGHPAWTGTATVSPPEFVPLTTETACDTTDTTECCGGSCH